MPTILRDLPFSEKPTEARFDGRHIPIKSDQIMVWVGITEGEQTEFDPRRPVFPAILDTGLSHNFSIRARAPDPMGRTRPTVARARGRGPESAKRPSHCTRRMSGFTRTHGGSAIGPSAIEPFRLALDRGIAVYPPTMSNAPRLPLLGLRALRLAGLHLTIDCRPMLGHAADRAAILVLLSGSGLRVACPPYFAARSPFRSRSALSHRSTSGMQATGPGSGKSRGARISSAWLAWRIT